MRPVTAPRPAPPTLAALAGLALAALLAGCTPRAVVPDAERARVRQALDGQAMYLRVAVTVHPLFGDASKRLLLDAPASEVDLLRGGQDEILAPPPAERILPPGTPVRIVEVEFPTGLLIARRVVMSPRYHPWVYLAVAGEPRPCVLVLSQLAVTADDVLAEVDRYLAADDPGPALRALPAEQHDAVLRKELVDGMSVRAVEMAWGQPERRRIDRPNGTEAWSWPGGRRQAFFQDEKLVRWER
jgi:hypothetical protein